MGLRLNARARVYRVTFCVCFIIIGVKQHILFAIIIIIYLLLLLVIYDILIIKYHRNNTMFKINLKRVVSRKVWKLD